MYSMMVMGCVHISCGQGFFPLSTDCVVPSADLRNTDIVNLADQRPVMLHQNIQVHYNFHVLQEGENIAALEMII